MLVHPHRTLHLAHQQAGKAVGKGTGLALGEVDQDVGDLGRLLGQIDPADGVRLVFRLRQPLGLGVGGLVRQRVDGRALGIALAPRQRVGMDRDEQRRRLAAGDFDPVVRAG